MVIIHVDGIEGHAGEKPIEAVIHLMNDVLMLTPLIQSYEVDRCQRIGHAKDRQGNPRKRPLLVKFTSFGSRARVLCLRGRLRVIAHGGPLENPSWPTPSLPPENAVAEPSRETVGETNTKKPLTYRSTMKTMLTHEFS